MGIIPRPTEHTWSVLCTLIFHIVMMMIHGLFAIHLALTCFPVMFAFLMKWTASEQLGSTSPTPVEVVLDSGADGSVLPLEYAHIGLHDGKFSRGLCICGCPR